MIKEYWFNVYEEFHIIRHKRQWYGAKHKTQKRAENALSKKYKCLYRIHVKMKEPDHLYTTGKNTVWLDNNLNYNVVITGNCGKPHTFKEWQVCKDCNNKHYPKYETPEWINFKR